MRYNFMTKKGFINSIVTQQGEGYVTSEEGKKGANDEIYMRHGKYTTCDNHEHPHFYLKLSMAKVPTKLVEDHAFLSVPEMVMEEGA